MVRAIRSYLRAGSLPVGKFELRWSVARRGASQNGAAQGKGVPSLSGGGHKLHFGPGPGWVKPDADWVTIDIDPERGDIAMDFRDYRSLPLPDGSVTAIYASHTFEHISIFTIGEVLADCHRVLAPGGRMRIIVPDAGESVRQYLERNENFPLFVRRREKAKRFYGEDYTIFECMKEDFISRSNQEFLLGSDRLAHQNAWDFESLARSLARAGFDPGKIERSDFRSSATPDFAFEGSYDSEANERDRSLYVEVEK